jgi:hypothetical protein
MAETKDKLATLSQVKRLVDSQSGGGASIELLWEGNGQYGANFSHDGASQYKAFIVRTKTRKEYNYSYAILTPNDSGLNKAIATTLDADGSIFSATFTCYVSGNSVNIGSQSGMYVTHVYGIK